MADGGKGIEEILATAESDDVRSVGVARIPMVPASLIAEHDELVERLDAVLVADTLDPSPERIAEMERLDELVEQMKAAEVTFTFVSIGYSAWSKILGEHPPSRAQLETNPRLDHNPVSFPLAAMAATCVDPVMTYEQVKRLVAAPVMTTANYNTLWGACRSANVSGVTPKVTAAGLIRQLSERSARRRTTTESPSPSSGAE